MVSRPAQASRKTAYASGPSKPSSIGARRCRTDGCSKTADMARHYRAMASSMAMHPPAVTHLLYLHGFRSSPQSTKARLVAARVQERHPAATWWCPQLPPSPKAAMAMVMDGLAAWPRDRMGVIGSSLGGLYATHVAQACGCRAVLLNPAVHPARDLARYIGEQTAWHDPGEQFR